MRNKLFLLYFDINNIFSNVLLFCKKYALLNIYNIVEYACGI